MQEQTFKTLRNYLSCLIAARPDILCTYPKSKISILFDMKIPGQHMFLHQYSLRQNQPAWQAKATPLNHALSFLNLAC